MERVYTYGNETSFGSSDHYFDRDGTSPSPNSVEHSAGHKRDRATSTPVSSSSNLILNSLPADLFCMIQPSLRAVYLEEDQYLYMQDGRLDYLYFPETAVISELRTLEDGRMVEVAITGREAAVGFSSLICSSRVANCTQVSQAGSAIKLDAQRFKKFLRMKPELLALLSPHMDHYIRQISQRAICNMFHSVRERLCTWLLLVQDRCGKKTLKLTHEQIARILGVYRPSVTCIPLEMRKDRLINYSRGGLSICDRGRMEDSACGCYLELAGA